MKRKSYRANNPVQVLGEVSDTQFKDVVHAGTPRDGREGGCYLWDAVNYISIPANNGDISSVTALNELGQIVTLSSTFVTDHYVIRGNTGEKAWNIKCWANGITPTDAQKSSYTLNGSGSESNLYTWLQAAEGSGNVSYKAYANGVNGQIMDAITDPTNPNSIFQSQNIYSWHNIVGYTLSDGVSYFVDQAATQLIPVGVYIPKNESIQLPPFKCVAYLSNGQQADLQYISHCQNNADFVGSACFEGNSGSFIQSSFNFNGINYIEVSFVLDVKSYSGGRQNIISTFNITSSPTKLIISKLGNSIEFATYGGPTNVNLISSTTLNLNSVNFIRCLLFGNTAYIYINGIVTQQLNVDAGNFFGGDLCIYAREDGTNGVLYDMGIFNIEIKELDSSGNIVQNLAHWPLCEPIIDPTNHTYFDKSGNGNHATGINLSL